LAMDQAFDAGEVLLGDLRDRFEASLGCVDRAGRGNRHGAAQVEFGSAAFLCIDYKGAT